MDGHVFDALAQAIGQGATRRRLAGWLSGALAGGALAASFGDAGEAKKKRKKKKKTCQPCQVKKKGKCKGPKPDGTACGDGKVCQAGQCVATCDPACVAPGQCVNGACVCPAPLESCGAVCCEETPECEGEVCACDGAVCSCPTGDQICNSGGIGQCCLPTDTCDPLLLCTTQSCSADNDFCNPEWAYCNDQGPACSCATSMEGGSVCGQFEPGTVCPDTSQCASDNECGLGEVCISACCEEGTAKGACVPLCAPLRERALAGRSAGHTKGRILASR